MSDDDVVEMLAALQRVLAEAVRNDDLSTHLYLGLTYAELGLSAEAVAELELVLQAEPEHPLARSALAVLRAERSSD